MFNPNKIINLNDISPWNLGIQEKNLPGLQTSFAKKNTKRQIIQLPRIKKPSLLTLNRLSLGLSKKTIELDCNNFSNRSMELTKRVPKNRSIGHIINHHSSRYRDQIKDQPLTQGLNSQKISTICLSQPLGKFKQQKQYRKSPNAQFAKKRSIFYTIKSIANNEIYMQFFMQKRLKK